MLRVHVPSAGDEMILREDKTQSNIPCVVCGKLLTNGQVLKAIQNIRYNVRSVNVPYTCSQGCSRLIHCNTIEVARQRYEAYNRTHHCSFCDKMLTRKQVSPYISKGNYSDMYCSKLCSRKAKNKATKGDNVDTQKLEPFARPEITASSEGCNVIRVDNTRPEFDKIVAAFMALSNAEKALLIHSFMPWQKLETLEAHYEEAYPTVKPILHSVKAGDKLFHPSCIEVPADSVNDKYIGVTIDSMKIVVDKHGYKTSDEKRKNRILFLNLDDYIEYAKSRGTK